MDEALEQLPCTFETRLQIQIAVEEMFVNIASYAYVPGIGVGIHMVKNSMDDVNYKYENGQNILTIR